MVGVKQYMKEDTKTVKEEEFKEGMKSYLDLIDSDGKPAGDDERKPLPKLNSIKKLKSSLLEERADTDKGNIRKNPQIKKLETKKIEAVLQQSETTKPSLPKENIFPTEQTHLVKKLFEEKEKEKSP